MPFFPSPRQTRVSPARLATRSTLDREHSHRSAMEFGEMYSRSGLTSTPAELVYHPPPLPASMPPGNPPPVLQGGRDAGPELAAAQVGGEGPQARLALDLWRRPLRAVLLAAPDGLDETCNP